MRDTYTYNLLNPLEQRKLNSGEFLTPLGFDYPQSPGHDRPTCISLPDTQYETINFSEILGLSHGNYQVHKNIHKGLIQIFSFDYEKITIEDFWENYILEVSPGDREKIKFLIEKSGYTCRIEGEAGFLVVMKKPCS